LWGSSQRRRRQTALQRSSRPWRRVRPKIGDRRTPGDLVICRRDRRERSSVRERSTKLPRPRLPNRTQAAGTEAAGTQPAREIRIADGSRRWPRQSTALRLDRSKVFAIVGTIGTPEVGSAGGGRHHQRRQSRWSSQLPRSRRLSQLPRSRWASQLPRSQRSWLGGGVCTRHGELPHTIRKRIYPLLVVCDDVPLDIFLIQVVILSCALP